MILEFILKENLLFGVKMKVSDLDFSYPEELIGLEPQENSRVMFVEKNSPQEITFDELLTKFI